MHTYPLKSLIFILLVFTFNAQALPFVESDAFNQGDNKAVYDPQSELTWLDFGINNGQSFNDVISSLDTTYAGWRLPTQTEVNDLWMKLMVFNGTESFYDVFDIWGWNKSPLHHLPFLCWGYFINDEGYLGNASIIETGATYNPELRPYQYFEDGQVSASVAIKYSDRKYDGSDYYPFSAHGIEEISTLLVRKSTVPEPSSLALAFLGIFSLIIFRKSGAK